MSVHGFRYQMFNSKDVGPSIEAGYGPYTSINQAIETILSIFRDDSTAEAYTTTGYAPPLGLHFGVIDNNNVFTEYEYKSGTFNANNINVGIVPVGSGWITLSDTIPTGSNGDTGSSTVALSTKGAYTLAQRIANSNSGVTDVKVNGNSVVTTGVANIPAAGNSALGVVQLGYTPGQNVTNQFALQTDNNKAYVEIPQVYLVSAAQKQVIDSLVEVYEDGVFVVDPNMQPVAGSGGGDYSALSDRLDRIEAILGHLMGSTSVQDATFIVENTQD